MKKTQPSFNNNLPALNVLSVELAAAVAGGNTGAVTDVTKTTEAIQTTNSNDAPTIPSGYGSRPPFN